MKKLVLGAILLFSTMCFSQEFKIEDKSISNVYTVEGKTKSEIYSAINKWVAINYNSAKNVIQMNDVESGTIIVKGINSFTTSNPAKAAYPNNPYILDVQKMSFNHLIEIDIKDNKFRVTYKITDVNEGDLTIGNISFMNYQEQASRVSNMEKPSLIGQKKWDLLMNATKQHIIDTNELLIKDLKGTILSINLSVKNDNSKEDKW